MPVPLAGLMGTTTCLLPPLHLRRMAGGCWPAELHRPSLESHRVTPARALRNMRDPVPCPRWPVGVCGPALARAPARIGLSACAVQRSRAHALRPALAVAAWARDINEYPCLACPVLHLAVSTHLVVEAADSPSKSTLPPLPFKCEPIITTAVAAVPTAGSLAAHQHPASCAAVSRLCTMA